MILADEGRAYHCLIYCHECLQKMLKGTWVLYRQEHPPQTDNLLWLARELEIDFPKKNLDLLFDLITVYKSRLWPDQAKAIRALINPESAEQYQEQTEDLILWLKQTRIQR